MNRKRILCLFLSAIMLVSLAAVGGGTAFAEDTGADIDAQLALIGSHIQDLAQQHSTLTWYYAVTDLNRNGRLEFVAAAQHPADRSTNLKVWEVSSDRTSLSVCGLDKDPDESFPDIITDMADTYHDTATDTWYYMLYDNIVISDTEVYTVKTAVSMKDNALHYDAYAVEHTVLENGYRTVSYTDMNGISVSAEQYNASGANAFVTAERSNTAFEWLTEDKLQTPTMLTDSYLVFAGIKAPTEALPVPRPAALQHTEAAPSPAPAQAQVQVQPQPQYNNQPVWLSITKNPTNENRKVGETAIFVACANAFESLNWTFVSPDGGEYSPQGFVAGSRAGLSGEYSTTISVTNIEDWMNGWGAYCTFYYQGQSARTSTAYINIKSSKDQAAPKKTDDGGVVYGDVTDWTYSGVTVNLGSDGRIGFAWDLCSVTGDIYIGAPVTAYWSGYKYGEKNFTYIDITGSRYDPQPSYGSMSGTAYKDTAFTVYVILQNGNGYHINGGLVNIIGGNGIDGAGCTVYYIDYPSEDNIYQVDIYGYNTYEPEYTYTQDGDAYELHEGYNDDGSTYNTVTCPACGREVSMAYDYCPYCSYDIWGYGTDSSYTYTDDGDVYELHEAYNDDGSTYDTVTCPECGYEVSMALGSCPNCGYEIWG